MIPYDAAQRILAKHLPSVAAANQIVASRFPAAARADRIAAGIWGGTAGGLKAAPVALRTQLAKPGPTFGPLAKTIADAAASGPVVDIRVWAGALAQEGVTSDTIVSAYETAGGDAELAAEEARGETSAFLGAFVEALRDLDVADEVIVGTYEMAGGRFG